MQLNLPVLDELTSCRDLLIAGMGGGFDVFCGLPIYFALRERGQTVHLANLTFARVEFIKDVQTLASGSVVGVGPGSRSVLQYCPELHLARWLHQARGEDTTVWCIPGEGSLPVVSAYRALTAHLGIDGVLLVDGGVDSLMRGDETQVGTVLEDSYSLAAVDALSYLPVRLLACLGFGAEGEVTHAHALENIAALTVEGAFRGACALTPQMPAFRAYADAIEFVHSQPRHDPSVINASVISAVRGEFGNVHATEKTKSSRLWINPLMALYWYFDAPAVARQSRYLPALANTASRLDALLALSRVRDGTAVRKTATHIDLP